MSFDALLNPIGFVADVISICNALGFQTPAQRAESKAFMKEILALQDGVEELSDMIFKSEEHIKRAISTAAVIEIRSRLPNNLSIDNRVVDSMIKLLFILKQVPARVTFVIAIRYTLGEESATLGMAGSTNDDIHALIKSINGLGRSMKVSKRPMTAFVGARCRGRHNLEAESVVLAALCCLVAEVFGLPIVGDAEDVSRSRMLPAGEKTVVLLRPLPVECEKPEYHQLCRIFLVGDTRTGKSSLGNAISQTSAFKVSKGMTGTLHIDCEYVLQTNNGIQLLTEVYDTPGLNDKDGLDVYYQASIEDKIIALQLANSLVLTIAVDSGITNSTRLAIEEYESLFGRNMVNMLIIVLTTNDSASRKECDFLIEKNWPTIASLVDGITLSNVMCVSLHDLRSSEESYSHSAVADLLLRCQSMPLKMIDSLSEKYSKIRCNMLKEKGQIHYDLAEITKDGWTAYDELTENYESAPEVKVTDMCEIGFVYKRTSTAKKLLSVVSLGACNLIRKFAVHVEFTDPDDEIIWDKFLNLELTNSHDAMRVFGDMLEEEGLAVQVKVGNPTKIGTLLVRRSYVSVFNPERNARNRIAKFIDKLPAKEKDICSEAIHALKNIAFCTDRHQFATKAKRR